MKRLRFSAYTSNSSDPDILYYNCTVNNQTQAQNPAEYPFVEFQENRTFPLITDVSQYEFSVVRFSMDGPGKALPLFIPFIQTGQSDPKLTIYATGLKCIKSFTNPITGLTSSVTLTCDLFTEFQTESIGAPLPNPPIPTQDLSSDYYYLSSYDSWLQSVNRTLELCYDNNGTPPPAQYNANPTGSIDGIVQQWATYWAANFPATPRPPFYVQRPPRITYSGTGSNGIFSVTAPSWGYGGEDRLNPRAATPSVDEEWYITMDCNMYELFHGLPADYTGNSNAAYTLRFSDRCRLQNLPVVASTVALGLPNQVLGIATTEVDYVLTQEGESTSSGWSPVENITFCTTLIPVNNEATGIPTQVGSGTAAASTTELTSPVLTDIALSKTDGYAYNQFIAYVPSAEYRMVSLIGAGELRGIDITVFWKSRLTGTLYPIPMPNGSSVSIKMMFRKKKI